MIKRTQHILKYQNSGKTEWLDRLFSDYKEDLRYYIDLIWDKKLPLKKYYSTKEIPINKIKSSNWRSLCCKNASENIRSIINAKTKNKSKPIIENITINLDYHLFNIEYQENNSEFDEFIKIRLPYFYKKKIKYFSITINLPIKYHKHFNKYKDWKRHKVIQLVKVNGQYYINLIFEKDKPELKQTGNVVGIDQGYKKLFITSEGQVSRVNFVNLYEKMIKRQQGSQNFRDLLTERNKLINQEINYLINNNNFKEIIIEDLKNVMLKSKLAKQINRKLMRWSYAKVVRKLEQICLERGIKLTKVSPAYTSQTCSNCGTIRAENRVNDTYTCNVCGTIIDADLNASVNILHRGVYNPSTEKMLVT
jgi:putative transposase